MLRQTPAIPFVIDFTTRGIAMRNFLGLALAAATVLTLALGTISAATPVPAEYATIGEDRPLQLGRMTVTATPLPATPLWA